MATPPSIGAMDARRLWHIRCRSSRGRSPFHHFRGYNRRDAPAAVGVGEAAPPGRGCGVGCHPSPPPRRPALAGWAVAPPHGQAGRTTLHRVTAGGRAGTAGRARLPGAVGPDPKGPAGAACPPRGSAAAKIGAEPAGAAHARAAKRRERAARPRGPRGAHTGRGGAPRGRSACAACRVARQRAGAPAPCAHKAAGLVFVSATLKDGRVPMRGVAQQSGYEIYAAYPANAIKRASPFPPVPASLMATVKLGSAGVRIVAAFQYVLVESSLTNILR